MGKNQDKRREVPEAAASPQLQPSPPAAPVSNTRLWVFWGAVALAVIAARTLDHLLPGISEGVIERWVMLAFGLFLALFLLKLE